VLRHPEWGVHGLALPLPLPGAPSALLSGGASRLISPTATRPQVFVDVMKQSSPWWTIAAIGA
jgi:hypothetical protein